MFDNNFKKLSSKSVWIERPIEEDEVFKVARSFNGDKAPGPDGFSTAFIQNSWSIVKDDMMVVFENFYHRADSKIAGTPPSLFSFQNKKEADNLMAFTPISFRGCIYKIIAKVLYRLKEVWGDVISANHNAFVKDHQILDAALIANKCIDRKLKMRENGVLY